MSRSWISFVSQLRMIKLIQFKFVHAFLTFFLFEKKVFLLINLESTSLLSYLRCCWMRFFITRCLSFPNKRFQVKCHRLLWCVIQILETLRSGGVPAPVESVHRQKKSILLWTPVRIIVYCSSRIQKSNPFHILLQNIQGHETMSCLTSTPK